MRNEGLHKTWRARLKSYDRSNKTMSAWCKQQGIPIHQFHYWRRRLAASRPPAANSAAHNNWMAVAVVPEPAMDPKGFVPETASNQSAGVPQAATSGLAVHVGAARIEVGPGFDEALLCAVVRALGGSPCSTR